MDLAKLEELKNKYLAEINFRKNGDTNQWVMKFWQIASGNISVRSDKSFRCFHLKDTNFEAALRAVKEQEYSVICLNDTAHTTDFETKRARLKDAFCEILGESCSFEK